MYRYSYNVIHPLSIVLVSFLSARGGVNFGQVGMFVIKSNIIRVLNQTTFMPFAPFYTDQLLKKLYCHQFPM